MSVELRSWRSFFLPRVHRSLHVNFKYMWSRSPRVLEHHQKVDQATLITYTLLSIRLSLYQFFVFIAGYNHSGSINCNFCHWNKNWKLHFNHVWEKDNKNKTIAKIWLLNLSTVYTIYNFRFHLNNEMFIKQLHLVNK